MEKSAITERVWLEDFDKWSLDSVHAKTTKQIYDALKNSGEFNVKYSKSEFQSRAHFLVPWKCPNVELVRAIIHVGNPTHKEDAWIIKERFAEWPLDWEQEFKALTGEDACMGKSIVHWCVEDSGNVERLIEWLIAKARKPDI